MFVRQLGHQRLERIDCHLDALRSRHAHHANGLRADGHRGDRPARWTGIIERADQLLHVVPARVAFLLARKGEPLPLSRLELKQELIDDYRELLPAISFEQARRIRGEQEIIVRYEPEKAVQTLPALLTERADRDRLLTLLTRLLGDERVQRIKPSPEQLAMLDRIRSVLGSANARRPRVVVAK